ncbi:hypothetical protein [Pseudobdellovibrio exovorus]|uniref:Adenylate kinase n=1 Tax=Pseudobdellovibrio exovorus JSS TaxID=1184267 RepID=M4V5P4_9BACT|nr:hypothetical protein [Pseudobdellovibrio exovorus]AGH94483.1 hypothetical protein A11Q_263 [Pseudobdellovibrio exovorus JSS]
MDPVKAQDSGFLNSDTFAKIKRINVVGSSATGKSTFSRRLARILNVPHVEMDQLFWKPNWTESTDDEFFPRVEQAVSQEAWVLDGNYTRTVPIKWQRVQMVVWLDYSFLTTLRQSIQRSISRAWQKKELWRGTGNTESFRRSFFSKKSVIWWMITNYQKNQSKYESYFNDPEWSHVLFVRLKSRDEAERFLKSIRPS